MSRELIQPSLNNDLRTQVFADALDRLSSIDLDPLYIYHLDTVGSDVLPHLAEQFSVTGLEGWRWIETDTERRHLIRNAISLHKLKGSLEGYKTILRLAKAKLRSYIAPPDKPHLSDRLTPDQWADFLAQMPQLRLYRYNNRGQKQGAMLAVRRAFLLEGTAAPSKKLYPAVSDAIARIRERAFLWEANGSTQELTVYDRQRITSDGFATTAGTAIRPGKPVGVFLVDHRDYVKPLPGKRFVGLRSRQGHGFLADHNPISRIYYLESTTPYQADTDGFRRKLLSPGYEQLRVQYDLLAERSTARGQFLGGLCWLGDSNPPPALTLPEVVAPDRAFKIAWNVGGGKIVIGPPPPIDGSGTLNLSAEGGTASLLALMYGGSTQQLGVPLGTPDGRTIDGSTLLFLTIL